MTQSLISKNLAVFLENTYPQLNPETKEKIYLLTENGGLCFGYALSFAAKRSLGKKKEWTQSLCIAAQTQEGPYSKKQLLHLDNGKTKLLSLKRIFQRIIYFTLKFQNEESQDDFFTQAKVFKIRDKGRIKTFAKRVSVAGFFSTNQIKKMLDPVSFHPKHVSVISGNGHAVSVWCENKTWFLYDPNNDSRDEKTLIKRFPNKYALVCNLVKRLSFCLTFQIGAYHAKSLPIERTYENIIKHSSAKLIAEWGFYNILISGLSSFNKILKSLKATQGGVTALKKALLFQSYRNISGLKHLISRVPDQVVRVLSCVNAMSDPEIVAEFSTLSMGSWNTLHCVAVLAPNAFSFVFACLMTHESDLNKIASLLAAKQTTGRSVFDLYRPGTNCLDYKGLRFFSDNRKPEIIQYNVNQSPTASDTAITCRLK